MRIVNGLRNASIRLPVACLRSGRHGSSLFPTQLAIRHQTLPPSNRSSLYPRFFSSTRYLRQDETPEAIEKVVRDAKQRFRDTLPKGYLSDEEYAIYIRLYGPPLRETEPEDVGIHMHADMGSIRPDTEGTVLKPLEGGAFEEVNYALDRTLDEAAASHGTDVISRQVVETLPGYVDSVARSERERDAMQRLYDDFQQSQHKQAMAEKEAAAQEHEARKAILEEDLENDDLGEEFDVEYGQEYREDSGRGEDARFHPLTLQGRFHKPGPIVMELPQARLVQPIEELLRRTNKKHLKTAAEAAYGGASLPTSPATVAAARRSNNMKGIGLAADQRHMTEIEADTFLGVHIPPAYVSILSILREVRRRVGSDWIQSKLKANPEGGLSVLDAGGGGAGLLAWEQILEAEWSILKEKGEVTGDKPPGKQTVITGPDRLRHRMKGFFDNTTFLPRLPDYEHSRPMRASRLDGTNNPQQRKTYDLVIASHLFLQETEAHHRQAVLNNLWSIVKPEGGVLVVLEKAHPRGFEAVAHVRDTLLSRYIIQESGQPLLDPADFNPAFHRELEPGQVLAPCTNQSKCPLYLEPGRSKGRKDTCHFSQRYIEPEFHAQLLGKKSNRLGEVEFSYVAIQRGIARKTDMSPREASEAAFQGYEDQVDGVDMKTLPRLMKPALKRKGHITMDMCTPEGKLERWTIPKSFGKLAYHDARKSHWGDLWALGAKTRVLKTARVGTLDSEPSKRRPRKQDIMIAGMKLDVRERKVKHKDKKMRLIQELADAHRQETNDDLQWEVEREIAEELEANADAGRGNFENKV
ncbi:hypothetical protein VHEMI06540 [[Torrubiella] hemipterigena]|uniref:37S ribosomal protein Rsm22 n=1 Tax=[Torrubiella] hemipterigena TaxID=1531966 RepID=A0A0A1TJD1_9HYPO|nr:hypothetical protein VHEMI06540 [[Torrubiella] hemipterigena]